MHVPSPPAEPPEAAEAAQARADREAQMAMLRRLAELGMQMAEAVVKQTAEAGAAEAGAAFAKIAQAVRRTILLQERVAKPPVRDGAPAQPKERPSETRKRLSEAKDSFIGSEIEFAATDRYPDDREAVESLLGDAEELLSGGEYDDFPDRPVGETIARLCRELGLDPDWCVQQVPPGETVGAIEPWNLPEDYADDPGPASWWVRRPPPPLSRYARPPADAAATGPPP